MTHRFMFMYLSYFAIIASDKNWINNLFLANLASCFWPLKIMKYYSFPKYEVN